MQLELILKGLEWAWRYKAYITIVFMALALQFSQLSVHRGQATIKAMEVQIATIKANATAQMEASRHQAESVAQNATYWRKLYKSMAVASMSGQKDEPLSTACPAFSRALGLLSSGETSGKY